VGDEESVGVAVARNVAVEHLRRAIAMWDGFRDMAKGDSDFDPIRGEPAFAELVG
jgi:hypothetical protein